jgi:imidazolonepropionase-like amidohydrolase
MTFDTLTRPNLKMGAVLLYVAAIGAAWAEDAHQACDDRPTLIESVRVFDGVAIIPEAHVVIRCQRISQLVIDGSLPVLAEDSIVVSGQGKTLLPGLFESHGHTFQRDMLERSLDFGVTTVLDMGSASPDFARNIKAEDKEHQATDRADLFTAVLWVTAPGSHGTQFGEVPTLTSPADAAAFVAQRIDDGADFIKLIYDNFKMFDRPVPTLSKETMSAVVEAAHAQGKMAVVHSRDVDAYGDVIEAGADGFVHVPVDRVPGPALIARIKKNEMYVGPNLSAQQPVGGSLVDDEFIGPMLTEDERKSLLEFFPKHREGGDKIAADTVTAMHEAGVTLLAGSDSPNLGTAVGASMHLELELLVNLGLAPVEALRTATSNPASAFGIRDRGRIAEGLLADLLLVSGKPDQNIKDTRRLHTIWKAGVAHPGPAVDD